MHSGRNLTHPLAAGGASGSHMVTALTVLLLLVTAYDLLLVALGIQ
jgi:hypothetical protein